VSPFEKPLWSRRQGVSVWSECFRFDVGKVFFGDVFVAVDDDAAWFGGVGTDLMCVCAVWFVKVDPVQSAPRGMPLLCTGRSVADVVFVGEAFSSGSVQQKPEGFDLLLKGLPLFRSGEGFL
jgi:hypothetical protein